MGKNILYFIALCSLLFSCEKEEGGKDIPEKARTRTVLAYMLAENSLNDFSRKDIAEMMEGMKKVDNADNMIIYVDDNLAPRLLKLEKDGKGGVTQKIIHNYVEQNSIDPEVMEEVFSRTFTTFPADSYGLILWSHGDGWLPSSSMILSFGQDGGSSGPMMSILALRQTLTNCLKYIKPASCFEFIMFDACFMQSVEVVYELRHLADYFVGSPIEIPGPGAPYQYVMEPMFANPCDVKGMAQAYYDYYTRSECLGEWGDENNSGNSLGVAVSLIKTSDLEALAQKTASLLPLYTQRLKDFDPVSVQALDMRRHKAYYDFGDFMKHLVSEEQYQEWLEYLQKAVPYAPATKRCYSMYIGSTFPMNVYSGISTYIPRSESFYSSWNKYYHEYEWYEAAGWEQTGW